MCDLSYVYSKKLRIKLKNCISRWVIFLITCNRTVSYTHLDVYKRQLLQPMDQGVLENIKCVYEKELLSKIIEEEGEKSVIGLLKSINTKDVTYMVAGPGIVSQ